jgi:hypothetical protein
MHRSDGAIGREESSAKEGNKQTTIAENVLTDYDRWLSKPCWYLKEICYLAQGLDPASMPGGITVDMESGENMPAPINFMAVVIAVELYDLLTRAVESGELQPVKNGSQCFKPLAVIAYLNGAALPRGVTLPAELLATLPRSADINSKNVAGSVASTRAEIEPIAGNIAEMGLDICSLFDPMSIAAIGALFDKLDKAGWKKHFERAIRNGLSDARESDVQPYQYNPAKVADWLVNKALYTREQAERKLANNLPPRSKDSKHKILGELG